jgi:hypothetical protein
LHSQGNFANFANIPGELKTKLEKMEKGINA